MNINATLIGQTVAFAFFVWFCMKYVWPPLTKVLSDRQKKVADGLAAAEKATRDLDKSKEKIKADLHQARAEAQEVIEQANKRAIQIIDEAKQQAQEEAVRLKLAADAEIEQEVNRARQALRGQVATLAVFGAEKIIGVQLDNAVNNKLVDDLAAQL